MVRGAGLVEPDAADGCAIDLHQSLISGLLAVAKFKLRAGMVAHPLPIRGMRNGPANLRRQIGTVRGRELQSGLAVAHDFRQAADVAGDHGKSASIGFENIQRQALVPSGGDHEECGLLKNFLQLSPIHPPVVANIRRFCGEGPDSIGERAITDNPQRNRASELAPRF